MDSNDETTYRPLLDAPLLYTIKGIDVYKIYTYIYTYIKYILNYNNFTIYHRTRVNIFPAHTRSDRTIDRRYILYNII